MKSRRIQDRLLSLVVSAMLTSAVLMTAPTGTIDAAVGPQPQALVNALNELHSGGWAGLQNVSVPTPVSAPMYAPAAAPAAMETPLSAKELSQLRSYSATYGIDIAIDKSVTDALGLTSGARILTIRELGTDQPDRSKKIISFLPKDGNILIGLDTVGGSYVYILGPDIKLIAAVFKKSGRPPVVIPISQAQAGVQTELAYWAKIGDTH
jgi:hypothetical protein